MSSFPRNGPSHGAGTVNAPPYICFWVHLYHGALEGGPTDLVSWARTPESRPAAGTAATPVLASGRPERPVVAIVLRPLVQPGRFAYNVRDATRSVARKVELVMPRKLQMDKKDRADSAAD